ncbi:hypothetical protein AAHE18_15G226800 [Arachis hypogaea]
MGTARGLAFLHEELVPHIVHRDIKASNILLDTDFNPKIGDFGLAKLFPDDITHISTRIAGTTGYLAPEYAIGGRSSSRTIWGDSYKLLLEWLTQMGEFPEEEVIRYMKEKEITLDDAAAAAAAPDATTKDGEKATAAPVITPEFRLANHLLLSKESGGYKNVAFSPLCIKLLLSIVAAGSNGPVCDELLSFLRSESINDLNSVATQLLFSVFVDRSSSGGPHLSYANGVWVDKTLSLKPSFSQVLENTYKSTFASLDFTNTDEVAKEINSWVERETKGVIKNLIDPDSIQLTDLIMANTLYFKGLWWDSNTFRQKDTRDGDFHLLDGSCSVKVPFMDGSHRRYAIAHHYQDFKVLSLDYKVASSENVPRRRYTMHIFLPDEINGLPALVEKVFSDSVSLESMLPFSNVDLGKLKIPRFKLSFKVEASPMLKEMGLVLPFMKEALITEIVEERAVSISEIIQKCIIEVNEEGTKAAAATTMHPPAGCAAPRKNKPPPFDFIADHPFLFLIREQYTETVLFVGQVLNPLDG